MAKAIAIVTAFFGRIMLTGLFFMFFFYRMMGYLEMAESIIYWEIAGSFLISFGRFRVL